MNIYKESPNSKYAPQALLAAGWILENNFKRGNDAIFLYDTLVSNYPKTPYATQVAPKLSFYKQEKMRIENAIKDSLAKIEREKMQKRMDDSLANVRKLDSLKNIKMQDSLKKVSPNNNKKEEFLPPPKKEREQEVQPTEPKEEEQKPPNEEMPPPGMSFLIKREMRKHQIVEFHVSKKYLLNFSNGVI